ncbi:MAG: polyprenyl synthetase family protein [bacterium]|nr:polyprenyl synthetase family protein [bacterium]
MNLKEYFRSRRKFVNQSLRCCFPKKEKYSETLWKAMHYSVFTDGKRLRPILAIAAYEAVSKKANAKGSKALLAACCTLEFIHTSSLILDDLPCMDNSDTRRDKPANHIVFGEGPTLLAADALLTYAFEVLAAKVPPKYSISLTSVLANAVGPEGMIGGQVIDIKYRSRRADYNTLKYIHTHKTGALFVAAVIVGATLADAKPNQIKALVDYSSHLGLAYQITDDILDVIQAPHHPRVIHPEVNFASTLGIEKAKKTVAELVDSALKSIARLNHQADPLREIAKYVEKRANGLK